MPPLVKIKKEDIIASSIKIVKSEGFNNLNARRLAKELNCSVQPIFSNFTNMEELKKVVFTKLCEIFYETITKVEDSSIPQYKQVGINYIKFAKEEPNIFNLIFLEKNNYHLEELFTDTNSYYLKIKDLIGDSTKLSAEGISAFHMKMWIFTHGLATLVASNNAFSDNEINALLTSEFRALLLEEKEGKKENEKNN